MSAIPLLVVCGVTVLYWRVVRCLWRRGGVGCRMVMRAGAAGVLGAGLVVGATMGQELWWAMRVPLVLEREREGWLRFEELPPAFTQGLQSAEDERFATRKLPIDLRGVARAVWSRGRGRREGASTLEMQVAREAFLWGILENPQERSWRRKLLEVVVACRLWCEVGKEDVIELYANEVNYGGHVRGLGAAAKRWFGREVGELTHHEIYALVRSVNAPSRYDEPGMLREGAEWVLAKAAGRGHLGEGEVEGASLVLRFRADGQGGVRSMGRPPGPRPQDQLGHALLRRELERHVGAERWARVERERLSVVPSFDLGLQGRLEAVVGREVGRLRQLHATPDLMAAVCVVEVEGARVRALVEARGGASEWSLNSQTRRGWASLAKVAVLAVALEGGDSLETRYLDAPVRDGWPRNSGGRWSGEEVTLRRGLERSLNTVFVRAAERWGRPRALEKFYRRAGLPEFEKGDLSVALGTSALTQLEVAGVMAAVARGGLHLAPTMVEEVRDLKGRAVRWGGEAKGERLASEDTMAAVYEALVGVRLRGTGSGLPAGLSGGVKTGSSDRDLRMVYVQGGFVVSVWVGRDRGGLWEGASAGRDLSGLCGAVFLACESWWEVR